MPSPTLTGNIQRHRSFPSRVLDNQRDILVYLPIGYRLSPRRRYPVLYLQDGQNVFDAATAFAGVEWGVDETAQRLIREKLIEPIIIVAIPNMGEERIHEYAPTRAVALVGMHKKNRSHGLLRKYGKFLTTELKPFIDRTYRTRPEADVTGVGGSSLGGLASIMLGLWFPQSFRRLAVMSPSVWWDNQMVVKVVESLEEKPPLRIWLDTGTCEPGWERARALRDALLERGWQLEDDLKYTEAEGAEHSERAWAERVDPMLRFLYPAEPLTSPALAGAANRASL
ncbi:MAG: alpha/beta hydrolase-fold protein [Verrucomicrobiota bacterium]